MKALAVEKVSHALGRAVLKEVTFSVDPGSFTVLLGPNGAGKTTLLSLVTGLYHAQAGSVMVFGHSMAKQPLKALALSGVVFQSPALDLDLTVAEGLRYHALLHGLSGVATPRAPCARGNAVRADGSAG